MVDRAHLLGSSNIEMDFISLRKILVSIEGSAMKNTYWHVVVLLGLISFTLFSQEDTVFNKWSKEQNKQYQEYLSKEDQQFLDYMEKEWKEFQAFQGIKPFDKPKPQTPPIVYTPIKKEEPKPIPPIPEEQKPIVPEKRKPVEPSVSPVVEKPQLLEPPGTSSVIINYFDVPIALNVPSSLKKYQISGSIDKETVRSFYEVCSKIDCEKMLEDIKQKAKEMRIGDWGNAQIADHVSHKIFPEKEKEVRLFTWYLLLRLGFDAKIGYTRSNNVYLLFPSQQQIYSYQYYSFPPSEARYYLFPANNQAVEVHEGLFTYEGNHPQAKTAFDFVVHKTPVFQEKIGKKQLHFVFNGIEYQIPVQYNVDDVEYVLNYPQVDFEAYFESAPSQDASKSLQESLQPLLKGRTEEDGANFLLRFVQSAFEYKTDDEQFGREKPFFPDETIYYPYSDCEDRAILFSYLIRSLLHLDVVGLHYPNHIATAVRFSKKIEGEAIEYQGKVLTVCDPTYINADIGMCMPQFKNVQPKVIAFHQ
jgi:hypothetical protein